MDTGKKKIEAFVEISTDDRNIIDYKSNFLSSIDKFIMSDTRNKAYTSRILRRKNKYANNRKVSEEIVDDSYEFEKPATITLDLGKIRDVKKVYLYGDQDKKQYPVKFSVVFINQDKKRITAFPIENNSLIEFTKDVFVKNVRYIELSIKSWSVSNSEPVISVFYIDDEEIYKQEDLLTIECLHEKVNNNEIKYGLSSDYCIVKILNKNRMFDEGKSNDKNYLNKIITPFVNNTKLGTFYIKEWKVSQDDMFVECKANDRLLDFQDIIYPGCMPKQKRHSFYGEFEKVLRYASKVKNFKYKIDYCLKNYAFSPYLKAESVWKTLQNLCEASLSHIYVDADNCIIVESELPFDSSLACYANDSVIIDTDISQPCGRNIADSKPYRNISTTYPIKPFLITISPSNAFSINIPRAANMAADIVELSWHEEKRSTSEKITEFTVNNAGKFSQNIILEDFYDSFELINNNSGLKPQPSFDLKNLLLSFKYDFETKVGNLELNARKISFSKHTYVITGKSSSGFLQKKYCHPDCELISKQPYAKLMADTIIHNYPSGTKSSSIKWRGDISLKINDNFRLIDRFGNQNIYMCTSVKTIIDGGMEQEIKGILIS